MLRMYLFPFPFFSGFVPVLFLLLWREYHKWIECIWAWMAVLMLCCTMAGEFHKYTSYSLFCCGAPFYEQFTSTFYFIVIVLYKPSKRGYIGLVQYALFAFSVFHMFPLVHFLECLAKWRNGIVFRLLLWNLIFFFSVSPDLDEWCIIPLRGDFSLIGQWFTELSCSMRFTGQVTKGHLISHSASNCPFLHLIRRQSTDGEASE